MIRGKKMKLKNLFNETVNDINRDSSGAIAYIPKNSLQRDNLVSFFKNVVNIFKNQEQNQIDEESKNKKKKNQTSLSSLKPEIDKESENQKDDNEKKEPELETPDSEIKEPGNVQNQSGEQEPKDQIEKKSNEPEHFIGPGERKISTQPEYGQAQGKGNLHLEYAIGKDESGKLKAAIIVRELERNKEERSADAKYLAHAVFSIENEEQFIEDLKHNRWQISRILKTSFGV